MFLRKIPRGECLFIPSGHGANSSDLEQIKCCLKCLVDQEALWRQKGESQNMLLEFYNIPIPYLETYFFLLRKSSYVVNEMNLTTEQQSP